MLGRLARCRRRKLVVRDCATTTCNSRPSLSGMRWQCLFRLVFLLVIGITAERVLLIIRFGQLLGCRLTEEPPAEIQTSTKYKIQEVRPLRCVSTAGRMGVDRSN